MTSGYDMDECSKPFAIIYLIYYRLVNTTLNPHARLRDIGNKTLLIQCSTPNAKGVNNILLSARCITKL